MRKLRTKFKQMRKCPWWGMWINKLKNVFLLRERQQRQRRTSLNGESHSPHSICVLTYRITGVCFYNYSTAVFRRVISFSVSIIIFVAFASLPPSLRVCRFVAVSLSSTLSLASISACVFVSVSRQLKITYAQANLPFEVKVNRVEKRNTHNSHKSEQHWTPSGVEDNDKSIFS